MFIPLEASGFVHDSPGVFQLTAAVCRFTVVPKYWHLSHSLGLFVLTINQTGKRGKKVKNKEFKISLLDPDIKMSNFTAKINMFTAR